jgi:hypothetical protein
MADQTTNLDTVSASQEGKDAAANALFDAASPATLYARRASTTALLTWGYYGGKLLASDGSIVSVANGTKTLTPSATNYLEADPATGAVSVNTSGFTSGKIPLYQIVCGTTAPTDYTDKRAFSMTVGGATASAMGDGTAGSPGIVPGLAFSSDSDTGFHRPAANKLSTIAGGEEVTRATTTGLEILKSPSADAHATRKIDLDNATQTLDVSTKTGDYTIAPGDAGTCIRMNVAGANSVFIPTDADGGFDVNKKVIITIRQVGAGQTTIAPSTGVSFGSPGGKNKLTQQYSACVLHRVGANAWEVNGDLSA